MANIENVFGGSNNDNIVIANTTGSTTVTGGLGSDSVTASAGQDNFRFTSAADSQAGNADQVVDFDATNDGFVFNGMTGNFASSIHFVGTDPLAGGGQSQAHLINGGTLLQIDVDGDGLMGANDMEVQLVNQTGTLSDSNFHLI